MYALGRTSAVDLTMVSITSSSSLERLSAVSASLSLTLSRCLLTHSTSASLHGA